MIWKFFKLFLKSNQLYFSILLIKYYNFFYLLIDARRTASTFNRSNMIPLENVYVCNDNKIDFPPFHF